MVQPFSAQNPTHIRSKLDGYLHLPFDNGAIPNPDISQQFRQIVNDGLTNGANCMILLS